MTAVWAGLWVGLSVGLFILSLGDVAHLRFKAGRALSDLSSSMKHGSRSVLDPLVSVARRRSPPSLQDRVQSMDAGEEMLEWMLGALAAGDDVDTAVRGGARQLPDAPRSLVETALQRHERGVPLGEALTDDFDEANWLRQVGEAIAIAEVAGGDLTQALEQVLDGLRRDRVLLGRLQVQTAEGRLALRLLGGLPWVLVAYLAFLHPELLSSLWTESVGRWGLAYAITSWAAGVLTMHRLVAPERFV